MIDTKIIDWLLDGDISLQYQVYRDLLETDKIPLKKKIATVGWGAKFLSLRNDNGHWGRGFYQPKWISTHYTLLDIKNLSFPNQNKLIDETIKKILKEERSFDGGVNPGKTISKSDVCINGMFLNYASYFNTEENNLKAIVDYILLQQMPDGGFNCQKSRKGAVHSSLHSTICVIEGINEYRLNGYTYRIRDLEKAERESREFILIHKLYQSHSTGKTIDEKMLKLSFPSRWRYDILRALDYFRSADVKYDEKMKDALDIIIKKRRADNKWPLQQKYPGQTHFEMEKAGQVSRWNTLRALRTLKHFNLLDSI
jgi:hypothetical protein